MIYGNPDLSPGHTGGGSGVTVAILDTGVSRHPDFTRADGSQVVTQCLDFTQKDVPLVEGQCQDDNGHGTEVAGILAAAGGTDGRGLYGVAPGATVWSYKVVTGDGTCSPEALALAIRTAADRGAQIISISHGSPSASAIVADAVHYAWTHGVLIVAAAGNSGRHGQVVYPAALKEVIAVAAVTPLAHPADFSTRGAPVGVEDGAVELAAPGLNVVTTSRAGDYILMSGTSAAAPHVAGLAALVWQGSASATRLWLQQAAEANTRLLSERLHVSYRVRTADVGFGIPQLAPRDQIIWTN